MVRGDFKKSPYVAVYGTLKRGFWNHYLLKSCKFLGSGITETNYELYDVGFPYAVPAENGYPLEVEVYELDNPKRLQALDLLEGYPYHYLRKLEYILIPEKGKFRAWIYYTKKPKGKKYLNLKSKNGFLFLTWEG